MNGRDVVTSLTPDQHPGSLVLLDAAGQRLRAEGRGVAAATVRGLRVCPPVGSPARWAAGPRRCAWPWRRRDPAPAATNAAALPRAGRPGVAATAPPGRERLGGHHRDRVGVHDVAVRRARSAAGIYRDGRKRGRGRYPRLADGAWLRQRHVLEGVRAEDIAAELGCDPSAVRAALRAAGIPRLGRAQLQLADHQWL